MIIQFIWHQPLLMEHLAEMFQDETLLDINRCWCITWQLFNDEDFYCYSISRAIITSRNVWLKIHLDYLSDWTKQLVLLMTSSHLKNKSKANVRWMLHWDGWRQGKARTTLPLLDVVACWIDGNFHCSRLSMIRGSGRSINHYVKIKPLATLRASLFVELERFYFIGYYIYNSEIRIVKSVMESLKWPNKRID